MKTAAIIPAFNEEERISEVLKAVRAQGLIEDIIVVDDGSSDRTSEVAARVPGVRVIELPENRGKAAALVEGVRSSDADLLVFLDADLVGIKSSHVAELVKPLIDNSNVAMTVGRFVSGRRSTNLSQKLAPTLSGQRAVRRDAVRDFTELSDCGYAFETILTDQVKDSGREIVEVLLPNVTHVMKEEKLGFAAGFTQRLVMYKEIFYYLVKRKLASNNKHDRQSEPECLKE